MSLSALELFLLELSALLLIAAAVLTWWLAPLAIAVGAYAGFVGARVDRGRRGLDALGWRR